MDAKVLHGIVFHHALEQKRLLSERAQAMKSAYEVAKEEAHDAEVYYATLAAHAPAEFRRGLEPPEGYAMGKMERAIRLILSLDGLPEVRLPKPMKGKSWVVRLDPKAREQLEDALKR